MQFLEKREHEQAKTADRNGSGSSTKIGPMSTTMTRRRNLKTEEARRGNNRYRLLEFLQLRDFRGATNGELLPIAGFRYGARLHELRKEGWIIETMPIADGEYRFTLKGKREETQAMLFAEMKPCTGESGNYPD